MTRAAVAAATTVLLVAVEAGAAVSSVAVSSERPPTTSVASGRAGALEWTCRVHEGFANPFHALIDIDTPDGRSGTIETCGEAFFVSGLGYVIAIQRPDTRSLPSRIDILDLNGNPLWTREARSLSCPTLSNDGRAFAYMDDEAVRVIDLESLSATSHARLAPFAVAGDGRVAGLALRETADRRLERFLVVSDRVPGGDRWRPLDETPLRISFSDDGSDVLVLSRRSLVSVDAEGRSVVILSSPPGTELCDLKVSSDGATVYTRDARGERSRPPRTCREDIPWPLAPDAQHPVGNTYGEYQNYGGAPYLHPGVDVMGSAGQPVYAVAAGVVKAVLTTSGQWHWRVAVADSATSGTSTGYLYAHLDQPTIVVAVGDTVESGEYLGDLVSWPVAGFHHCHFARIEDDGIQWFGDWLAPDNPHTDFDAQTETEAPVFEPALGVDLLAFCINETSTYLDPNALVGAVDIVAHVGDRAISNWVCSVQELRYTIYPEGYPESPVVDDKLAVRFDMALDTYYGGPIDPFLVGLLYKADATCETRGDYDYREFYHILTNSDGNEVYEASDLDEAWDTSALPDANYVVRVKAIDAAGNATADSMTVTTANGNPTSASQVGASRVSMAESFPNPCRLGATFSFSLPADDNVAVRVYAPSGRLVRTVATGRMPAGTNNVSWDLRDDDGSRAASGLYLVRLETSAGRVERKVVVAR